MIGLPQMIKIVGTRFRQMTNIPGCFNIGESEYQYHGANRLGANSLLSCIYGGLVAGVEIPKYIESKETQIENVPQSAFDGALQHEQAFKDDLLRRSGPENVHALHDEMADLMVKNVTVKRNNTDLKATLDRLKEIRERYKNITLSDSGSHLNQTYVFANQFQSMIELAMVMTKGALLRDEFRGSHYKPEFPERDDKNWLKSTIATYDADGGEPKIDYEAVDIRHLEPVLRDYVRAKKVKPTLKNVPNNIELPI